MIRSLALASLLASTASAALAQSDTPGDRDARVAEILQHLETFMPERPAGDAPLAYTLPDSGVPAIQAIEVTTLEPVARKAEDGLEATPVAANGPAQVPQADDEAAPGDTASVDVPAPESDGVETTLEERLEAIDFGELARDAQLVPMIGQDMMEVGRDYRGNALHDMARTALLEGNPAAFRKIMAAYVDPAWSELDDSETALQMIAWMPDTAAFLGARIAAASLAGAAGVLERADQDFLWKDLRARVERVGSEDLTNSLLEAMLQTGYAELAVESIKRRNASNHERITTYVRLVDTIGPDMPAEGLARLVAEIEGLRGDIQATRYDPNAIALAYWKAGLTDQALDALAEEADPALRLRTRFEMLLESR